MVPPIRFLAFERPRLNQLLGASLNVSPGVSPDEQPGELRSELPTKFPEASSALVLVHAPFGYGKTTAAAQWARRQQKRGQKISWVNAGDLEAGESFWQHFLREVAGAPEDARGPYRRAEGWVSQLVKPTAVVIDDYHRVTSDVLDSQLHALVASSRHLQMTVLARRFTTLDRELPAPNMETTLVTAADLEFTAEEASALAELFRATAEPPAAGSRVGSRVGSRAGSRAGSKAGWGLNRAKHHLALSSTDSRGNDSGENYSAQNNDGCPDGRYDGVLFRNVTGGWPVAVRAAIDGCQRGQHCQQTTESLLASIVSALDDPVAERVLAAVGTCPAVSSTLLAHTLEVSPEEVKRCLTVLEDLGLIIRERYMPAPRYSCRPVAAQWVRENLAARFDAQPFEALRYLHVIDIAPLRPVDAFRLAVEAEDYELANEQLLERFTTFLAEGEKTVKILRRIPQYVLFRYPALLGSRIVLERQEEPMPVSSLSILVETLPQTAANYEQSGSLADRAIAQGIQLAAYRMAGNWEQTERLYKHLWRQLSEADDETPWALWPSLPFVHLIVGLSAVLVGDYRLSGEAARRALEISTAVRSPGEQIRALSQLALSQVLIGEVGAAKQSLRQADQIEVSTGARAPELSWVNAELARILAAYHGCAPDPKALEKILPFSERLEQWPILLIAEAAVIRQEQGDYQAFLQLEKRYRTNPRRGEISPFMRTEVVTSIASHAVYAGRYLLAEEYLQSIPADSPKAMLTNARLKLFRGDASGAQSLLEQMEPTRGLAETEEFLAIQAVAAYEAKNFAAAGIAAGKLADLMEAGESHVSLSTVPFESLQQLAIYAQKEQIADIVRLVDDLPEACRARRYGSLSPAELRVLRAARTHRSVTDLAEGLFLSANTVKTHLRSIYQKLGVTSRTAALSRAQRLGLLTVENHLGTADETGRST